MGSHVCQQVGFVDSNLAVSQHFFGGTPDISICFVSVYFLLFSLSLFYFSPKSLFVFLREGFFNFLSGAGSRGSVMGNVCLMSWGTG